MTLTRLSTIVELEAVRRRAEMDGRTKVDHLISQLIRAVREEFLGNTLHEKN